MSNTDENSAAKPTVIDLDPDQVVEEGAPAAPKDAAKSEAPKSTGARQQSTRALPIAVAAIVIGAVGGGWLYKDVLSSYFPDDHVKALSEKVDSFGTRHEGLSAQVQSLDRLAAQLKTDVDELESAGGTLMTETKSLGGALEALRNTVTSLQLVTGETRAALDELANRPIPTSDGSTQYAALPPDLAQRIAALEKDIAALKAQKTGAVDTAALTQSLADLKAKIEAGVSFSDEHARIARMVPAAAGLEVLGTHAASGLPSAKGLATELAALKPSLPKLETLPANASEAGWLDSVTDALSSVITIRDASSIDWQQTADKAIVFADAGDLPQAVAAIDKMEEAAPAGLQQWRDRAAARIALEAGLASAASSVARVVAAGQ